MRHFTQLYRSLDETNKTNAKVKHLVTYFHEASDEDKLWALFFFSGKKIKKAVTSTQLQAWCCEAAGIPQWLFDESYYVAGDLAETISTLIPDEVNFTDRPLSYFISTLKSMDKQTEEEKKQTILSCWRELNRNERFVFNKLITGGFRIGVSQQLVVRALAQQTGIDAKKLVHRLMGDWTPGITSFHQLISEERLAESISTPYPFCLAHPLDESLEELGDAGDWQAEWKWDGIRGQMIFRSGELFLWSRGEELITASFPEFEALKEKLPQDIVLDGEILPYRDKQIQGFQLLQQRIGRKKLSPKILADIPVAFFAYDLLEHEGQDIREMPLEERRQLLEKAVLSINSEQLIKISPKVNFENWEQLSEYRQQSRDINSEGLMLKHKRSPYEVGRKRGHWWKWKVDPYSVDAVLIYAQSGHGRRANLYTDYTFAVWNEQRELVPFAKAYSGLTDEEINQVDAYVKQNTIERFGPVRSVVPKLVFEIGFEGIQESKRHKSGIALRFPRILRWRTDKKMEDADTLESLKQLLNAR